MAALLLMPVSSAFALPPTPKILAGEFRRIESGYTQRTLFEDGAVRDRVIAAIDGEPITIADLKGFARAQGQTIELDRGGLDTASTSFRMALRELLVQRLIDREAKGAGITVADAEVDAYIAQVKAQNGVDERGFSALLAARGITGERYREEIRSDIARSRFITSHFRSKLAVSPADIEEYLTRHPEERPSTGTVHIQQIQLPVGEETRAAELQAQLKKGGAWKELGGEAYLDLGFMAPSDLILPLQQAAESLGVGETSPVIKTEQGLFIVGVVERVAAEPQISEALRDRVRGELLQGKLKAEVERFVTAELPQRYVIEIKF